ncbi:MAG: FtsX-like permease family protein [Culicoidibacterales bacterium]
MYAKMARNNVRKSVRDYTIYFLTLALGVCLFYAFNAISDQSAFTQMTQRQADYVAMLEQMMNFLSLGISAVLGALIVYANHFLIKRRKREFGVYTTLGMSKWHVALILTIETLVVGIGALVVGLVAGVAISQLLSAFATQLFTIPLSEYQFLWSPRAAGLTCVYFIVIFTIVLSFNSTIIAKQKLIDLLGAPRRNQQLQRLKPWQAGLISFGSITMLACAYFGASEIGLDPNHQYFWLPIVLGIVGTFGSFYSLGGLLLIFVQKQETHYLKGIRMFSFRQIASKMQTNHLSMTVICVLLFVTIGALATSLGLKTAMAKDLALKTPFDASVTYYGYDESNAVDLRTLIEAKGFTFADADFVYPFAMYTSETNLSELFFEQAANASEREYLTELYSLSSPRLISVTDYNAIQSELGEAPLTLAEDEVFLVGQWPKIEATLAQFVQSKQVITVAQQDYTLVNDQQQTQLSPMVLLNQASLTGYALIVPETVVAAPGVFVTDQVLNINLASEQATRLAALDELFYDFYQKYADELDGYFLGLTREAVIQENAGFTNIILFIGLYLSFILLLASAAILALQQLSETTDSLPRYQTLQRLGVSARAIKHAILVQIGVYFVMPIGLACIHAIVGIRIVQAYLIAFGKPDIMASALMTAAIFLLIYGGYGLATYWLCLNQVREQGNLDV